MQFLSQFIGAFYSASMYRRLRMEGKGYGIGYSFGLLALVAAACLAALAVHIPAAMAVTVPNPADVSIDQWVLVGLTLLGLRACMLLALAVTALLASRRMKLGLNMQAAFRVAGVAYTPAAVMDGVALCVTGIPMNPPLLFVGSVAMLLAALSASR